MGRILGFVGLVVVLAVGAYIYSRQVKGLSPKGTANIRANVDLTGVRNDLLALAQAERRHFATEAKYASLDDLVASGEVLQSRTSRGPYTYSVDFTDSSFVITATCSGEPPAGLPRTFSVDQDMQLRSE